MLLAWLPQVLTRDLLTFLFFTYVFIVLAANYDLLGGFLRYMNLGQGAFFGLAAYIFAVLLQHFPAFFLRLHPLGLPVAGAGRGGGHRQLCLCWFLSAVPLAWSLLCGGHLWAGPGPAAGGAAHARADRWLIRRDPTTAVLCRHLSGLLSGAEPWLCWRCC